LAPATEIRFVNTFSEKATVWGDFDTCLVSSKAGFTGEHLQKTFVGDWFTVSVGEGEKVRNIMKVQATSQKVRYLLPDPNGKISPVNKEEKGLIKFKNTFGSVVKVANNRVSSKSTYNKDIAINSEISIDTYQGQEWIISTDYGVELAAAFGSKTT